MSAGTRKGLKKRRRKRGAPPPPFSIALSHHALLRRVMRQPRPRVSRRPRLRARRPREPGARPRAGRFGRKRP